VRASDWGLLGVASITDENRLWFTANEALAMVAGSKHKLTPEHFIHHFPPVKDHAEMCSVKSLKEQGQVQHRGGEL